MESVPGNKIEWQKIWQLTSGIYYKTPKDLVLKQLQNVSKEIHDGIVVVPLPAKTANKIEEEVKQKCPEKLWPFIQKLQKFINLDYGQTWEHFCYYLIYEYRGSANSLSNYLCTETNMIKLLNDIWEYYSLERMVQLKIVRNILQYSHLGNHPYSSEYKEILSFINVRRLQNSYIDQFELLIKDVPPSTVTAGEFYISDTKLADWSERKVRETIEILHIIILSVELDGIDPKELKRLVDIFKSHLFGRQQQYLDSSVRSLELIERITYCEVALFLRCIDIVDQVNPNDWIEECVQLLDDDIKELHQNVEHGPILLGWMLLNFYRPTISNDNELSVRYRQFGGRAVRLGCFEYLLSLVSHSMFRDQSVTSRIVRRTIYNHLSHLCGLFDGDGSVAQHPKIYELLCELLTTPSLAKMFCNQEDETGVRSLYNTALENFPIDFCSLSMIANALATTGPTYYFYIRDQLESLPIYCEIYQQENVSLHRHPDIDDEYILADDYVPFRKINYRIPAGTSAIIIDKRMGRAIHFRTAINYFDVLHNEVNQLLIDSLRYTEIDEEHQRRCVAGLKYLRQCIRRIQQCVTEEHGTQSTISSQMVHPTEMIFDILNKFKSIQSPPIELLSICLEICGELMSMYQDEIYQRIITLNILPHLSGDNVMDYTTHPIELNFESSLVGFYLVNFEKKSGKYSFLLAYLKLLKSYSQLCLNNVRSIEFPGLLFILREVYPHIHEWRFQNDSDRISINTMVMEYFLDILTLQASVLKYDKERLRLRDTCVYSLLNLDNGMTLLRFLSIGNQKLQSIMQFEMNWMIASTTGYNHLVQLSMTILMEILRLRSSITISQDDKVLSPLESIIYTQPKQWDRFRIIPMVTSYMANIFNRQLPRLACQLLRQFALEFQMSLLACLDMEPYQIRQIFLQRLHDDLEGTSQKIAIIRFVEACVCQQPGLTEAFFNISYDETNALRQYLGKIDRSANICDGMVEYLDRYLDEIDENENSKATASVISIFHQLWKNNMQNLIKKLIDKPKFWPSLMKLLLNDFDHSAKLFNILGIELFECAANDVIKTDLKQAIERILDKNTFQKYVDEILSIPGEASNETDETPKWLNRLQSSKDFLIILIRRMSHEIEVSEDARKYLTQKCLQALVDRSNFIEDYRPFIILSELSLMLLLSFRHRYTDSPDQDIEMFKQMSVLLNNVSTSYDDIHCRARESILAMAFKTVDLFATGLSVEEIITSNFINAIIQIIWLEIREIEANVKTDGSKPTESDLSFVLSLNLLKKVLITSESESLLKINCHLISNRLCNRLLNCLNVTLQDWRYHKIVKEMIDLLVVIAQSACTEELYHCDIGYFLWLKLLPPKELLQTPYEIRTSNTAKRNKLATWQTNDWWPIYSGGIELVTIMLTKLKHLFIKEALIFVGVHEEYLMDSILLAKQSLDPTAMTLITSTLGLVLNLIQYEKQWRLEHVNSLINLMRCVQVMLDHSVSLLYRPKILKQLIEGRNSSAIDLAVDSSTAYSSSDDGLISAMNELIRIVTICSKCLLAFSPKLINLIADIEFIPTQWQPLIEIQFGAPKLNVFGSTNSNFSTLSFGTVLSGACMFTKSLNVQHHTFYNVPLNSLPNDDNLIGDSQLTGTERSDDTLIGSTSTTQRSSPRSPFSKSLSITSTTSTSIIPSNEILSNLDGKLCLNALEHLLTLLASQSMLALKDINLSHREKQLIKRELCTELYVFHDFVKKKITSDLKDPLVRKKFGIYDFEESDDEPNLYQRASTTLPATAGTTKQLSHRDSMRVQVTRKLHLTHQHSPTKRSNPFDMSQNISPIGESTPKRGSDDIPSSTLRDIIIPQQRSKEPKRVSFQDTHDSRKLYPIIPTTVQLGLHDENEQMFYEPEEPTFSGYSMVRVVEEDYLQFLSNLFLIICQN